MSFGSILSNKNGQAGSFIGGNKPLGDIEKAAFKVKSTEVQDYHWGSPRRRVKSRKGARGMDRHDQRRMDGNAWDKKEKH